MKIRLTAILCGLLVISGCATAQRPSRHTNYHTYPAAEAKSVAVESPLQAGTNTVAAYHTVRPGETMWSISKMYNVDLGTLAKANQISDRSAITKGQILTIPAAVTTSGSVVYAPQKFYRFAWPVRGTVVSRFGEKVEKAVNKGIDISAAHGKDVVAAKDGRVVYCDSYFKGFGQTVIVDHADGYQTVYSYNSDILVKVGDMVRQNQAIAKVGQSGRAKEPMLHFEIRQNGEPQDPIRYLQ